MIGKRQRSSSDLVRTSRESFLVTRDRSIVRNGAAFLKDLSLNFLHAIDKTLPFRYSVLVGPIVVR